jgi:DNA-directed RNA polymerase
MLDVVTLTEDRFQRKLDRTVEAQGWAATDGAFAIINRYLTELHEVVIKSLKETEGTAFGDLLHEIGSELLTLIGLQIGIESIAQCETLSDTLWRYGRCIQNEGIRLRLYGRNKELASRIERAATRRYSSIKMRRAAIRAMAKKSGFREMQWSNKERLKAAEFIFNCAIQCAAFILVDDRLELTESALQVSDKAVRALIHQRPVFLPCVVKPEPWTSLNLPMEGRITAPLMRAYSKEARAALKEALSDGSLQPTLDALNAIQSTAWAINEPVLAMVRWCHENEMEVDGLVPKGDLAPKGRHPAWETLSDPQKRAWRRDAAKVHEINRSRLGERLTYARDMNTADYLIEHGNRFWVPHNMDYRGRVYPTTHFSFQRGDSIRALFRFADGKPLGAEGLYWLKVHVANTGAFDKIDKAPFAERVAWVDANLDRICMVATYCRSDLWWTEADSPFMFLAAATELRDAMNHWEGGPETYVSTLPVSFDGSCSGLQHLSAMMRAPEGAYVNLTPSETPQDVYQRVADIAHAEVTGDLGDPEKGTLARMALDYGVDRKLVKRSVMTYAYSSKKFGMSQQFMEDTMRPLADQVLAGKLDAHPLAHEELDTFTNDEGVTRTVPGMAASRYLASITFDAVEQTVPRCAEAMGFLQQIARACAHANTHVRWTTPLGLPVVLRHMEKRSGTVRLFLHDRGAYFPGSQEETRKVNKAKLQNGVSPCFVHSMDACHLMMVALEANKQGLDLALVHDSFGCHAADAAKLRHTLKDTFRQLYADNDPLAQILVETQGRIDTTSLPELPDYGSLNLNAVMEAEYAFA